MLLLSDDLVKSAVSGKREEDLEPKFGFYTSER
jgi:hypothetical protein